MMTEDTWAKVQVASGVVNTDVSVRDEMQQKLNSYNSLFILPFHH